MLKLIAKSSPAGDKNLVEIFGINYPGIIAQAIIIGAVYLLLKKYAFGPIVEMLEERKNRIKEAEENAEKIKEELAKTENNIRKMMQKANKRSERLIQEAKLSAQSLEEKEKNKALEEAKTIIQKAQKAGELEREQTIKNLKSEFGKLIVSTTSKISSKILSDQDHDKINKEAAKEITSI